MAIDVPGRMEYRPDTKALWDWVEGREVEGGEEGA